MASIINAATSGGLISTADTSGVLQLQTAGTTAVTVDASQNVGVGVTPSAWGSAYKAIQFGPQGVISNESTNSGFVSYGVNFYRNASAQWTYIETDTATKLTQYGGEFQFLAAPSGTAGNAITWTQILSASKGNTFALEGATSTTGAGIAFPATQVASTNANTLDDYEEGTWTATLSATGGTFTVYARDTRYTKIGRAVSISGYAQIYCSAGSGANAVSLTGLPFTSASGGDFNQTLTVGFANFFANASGFPMLASFNSASSTTVLLRRYTNDAGTTKVADINSQDITNANFSFMLNGTYFV